MKSPHARLMRLALVGTLMAGSLSAVGGIAIADPNALKAKAQAELTTVTREVDKANVMFSPADHSAGFNLAKNAQYHQEYEAGVKSFNAGRYADAMQHLSNADRIIRSRPNWNHAE
jgi:TolA-binding protein